MKTEKIRKVLAITITGCAAAIHGVLAVAVAVASLMLYSVIPDVSGYLAVGYFFAATIGICFAIALLYSCGLWIAKKGSFLK